MRNHFLPLCRCKVASDLTVNGGLGCTAQCEKCGADISAAFRPGMLHQYSDVLGYLDLSGVVPMDLVLQESELVVGCLGCSQEDALEVRGGVCVAHLNKGVKTILFSF